MKLKNAILQLEKHIGPVRATPHGTWTRYRAAPPHGRTGVEFVASPNTDEIFCVRVRTEGDEDDPSTDYIAGSWSKNIKQAIGFVREYCWPSKTRED